MESGMQDGNMDTANKILIIGVGGAGVIAADKMNLPNSKKLFIDSGTCREFENVESEGDQIVLTCKDVGQCSGFCRCYYSPVFCKKVAEDYEDEIRERIMNAFKKGVRNAVYNYNKLKKQ